MRPEFCTSVRSVVFIFSVAFFVKTHRSRLGQCHVSLMVGEILFWWEDYREGKGWLVKGDMWHHVLWCHL